jgi:quercetin dioxygenase-like cupin family protein
MKVTHYSEIEAAPVKTEGASGVTIRWLIAKEDGAEKFAMRLFEIQPGGQTPLHVHEWEHEVFILSGEGAVWREGHDVPVQSGTAIFVPAGEEHCFKNIGHTIFRFLCLIPV